MVVDDEVDVEVDDDVDVEVDDDVVVVVAVCCTVLQPLMSMTIIKLKNARTVLFFVPIFIPLDRYLPSTL